MGIYTKTAIHPAQIAHIHHALQVQPEDFHEAQLILAHDAKSVFKSHGSMIEPATHKNWAEMILLRYKNFWFGQILMFNTRQNIGGIGLI